MTPDPSTAQVTGQFTQVIHEEVVISSVLLVAETLWYAAIVHKG